MIRLALLLARGGGRRSAFRIALIAFGTAFGVFALLLGSTFPRLLSTRQARAEARWPNSSFAPGKKTDGWAHLTSHVTAERRLEILFVAATPTSPLPPGVTEMPAPGEAVVSPALADALQENSDLRRFVPEEVTARIAPEGLVSPDEFYAYVGKTREELPDVARPLGSFGADLNPEVDIASGDIKIVIISFLGLVGIPLAAYFAVCSRLSAATRDRRLAALRLIGLDAKRTRRVNALEPTVAALFGSLLGLGVFAALNSTLASLRLGGIEWFPEDSEPTVATVLLCVVVIPAFAALLSTLASRSAISRALFVRRQAPLRGRSGWRLLPLMVGLGILSGLLVAGLGREPPASLGDGAILFLLGGCLLTALGLAFGFSVLPVAVARSVAARTSRPWLLLGLRRLEFEPSSVTRVVSGLVLVVFGMGFANGLQRDARAANTQVGDQQLYAIDPVEVPEQLRRGLLEIEGVDASLVTMYSRSSSLPPGSGPPPPSQRSLQGLWGSCGDLAVFAKGEVKGCEEGEAYTFSRSTASKIDEPMVARFPLEIRRTDRGPTFGRRLPEQMLDLTRGMRLRLGDPDLFFPLDDLPGSVPPESSTVQLASPADEETVVSVASRLAEIAPTATVRFLNEDVETQRRAAVTQKLLHVALLLGVLVGLSAFIVASIDRALERRQNLTALSMVGVSARTLRGAQAVQVALPIALASAVAIFAGKLVEQVTVVVGGYTHEWEWSGIGLAVGVALGGLVLSVAATALSVSSRIEPSLIRRE